MSRIGRLPIEIPAGVTVNVSNENVVTVKGPLGELSQEVNKVITVEQSTHNEKPALVLTRQNELKETKSMHGLYRALIYNMVIGVTKGFEKSITINGVGFKCAVAGNKLTLNIGFSHPVVVEIPAGLKVTCPSATEIKVEGSNKTLVGQFAADIKAIRPVEPYHGYGIRYTDEFVMRKEIKKAAKKK